MVRMSGACGARSRTAHLVNYEFIGVAEKTKAPAFTATSRMAETVSLARREAMASMLPCTVGQITCARTREDVTEVSRCDPLFSCQYLEPLKKAKPEDDPKISDAAFESLRSDSRFKVLEARLTLGQSCPRF
jgi:hypothetical protein